MLNLLQRLSQLIRRHVPACQGQATPDAMSLRDWADLPAYHPRCEEAPR